MGADAMKSTSRILEGLTLLWGLVEPQKGIGCGAGREAGYVGGRQTEKGPRGATAGAFQAGTSADLGPA